MDINKTVENKTQNIPETAQTKNASPDEKFVPTCNICGQKHWPAHPLIPCLNLKKAKEKARAVAKAEKKARALANAEAKAKAKAEKRAYNDAIAEARENAKAERQARTRAEEMAAVK